MTRTTVLDILSYIGVAAVTALLYYLFFYQPDVKKAFENGKASIKPIEVYIPGKDSIIYRDTSFTPAPKPVVIEKKDSIITAISSFDSSLVSGKDTIRVIATVRVDIKEGKTLNLFEDVVAKWFMNIKHSNHISTLDTVKILYPVDKPIEVEWYRTDTFAYIVSGTVYLLTLIAVLFN